jgi:hypothetical protein
LRRPKAATHWSARRLAKEVGLSPATVHRIWQKYGLQPHRVETFKFSRDPRFEQKLADVVGLYLDPPERALALCVDEKSQIQALDRIQAALPMWPGLPARMTHDYVRHGTTSLVLSLSLSRNWSVLVSEDINARVSAVHFCLGELSADPQEHKLTDSAFASHQLHIHISVVAHFQGYIACKAGVDFRRGEMNAYAEARETASPLDQAHQVVWQANLFKSLGQNKMILF